ncbi:hypothetical protein BDY21DRAFT_72347 [Lineolata rhizophorae]|uniref:Uncharacterized protein n=1 Tax=Lineolata rhizophorae TaxID=578093 RepID=A0A6A6NU15_9PEZI|nr:hypothetical protein BDY21DRAFT_72347 [Lineolata rhizophorae]
MQRQGRPCLGRATLDAIVWLQFKSLRQSRLASNGSRGARKDGDRSCSRAGSEFAASHTRCLRMYAAGVEGAGGGDALRCVEGSRCCRFGRPETPLGVADTAAATPFLLHILHFRGRSTAPRLTSRPSRTLSEPRCHLAPGARRSRPIKIIW